MSNKPEFITEEHMIFLDVLRESGQTNMFGATPYLQNEFIELDKYKARQVLMHWMETFEQRHPQPHEPRGCDKLS